MEELIIVINQAIFDLVSRNTEGLESKLSFITEQCMNVFPAIITSYTRPELIDCMNDATKWPGIFEKILSIKGIEDAFVLYDILYTDLYKNLADYRKLLLDREITL